jgi:heme/copper-type cytochrome/quinol oxidase subunit 2
VAIYGVLIWTLSILIVIGCVVLFALVRFVVPHRRTRRRVQRGAPSGSGVRPAASRAARRSSTSIR